MAEGTTMFLRQCLQRLQQGDAAACESLVAAAAERFRALARRLLHRAEDVARWEQTDDVIQEAMVKLHRELRRDVPPSIEVFFWRTSKYIRQTLVDLARRHRFASAHQVPAAPSAAEEQSGTTPDEPQDTTHEPGSLIQWGEVHEQIDQLREEHRQMFDLLYYQELTQDEAAELLGVNRRTVIRRWQSARRELVQRVDGSLPGDV